jgi:hypothetical protein
MPDEGDSKVLQVISRQVAEDLAVELILAKCDLVLA